MVSLNFLSAVVTAPKGLWEGIILGMNEGLLNFGLTIVLLTLIIKVAFFPIDFWQKYTQQKTAFNQAKMKPELEAIQKRYAYDKTILNQKTMEVYKKHKVSPMGSCFALVVNLVLVMTVFVTLITGINKMADYRMKQQYFQLEQVYTEAEALELGSGQAAVVNAFKHDKNIKENFLWIKNIWRKDTNQSVIPKYEEVDTKNWDKKANDGKGGGKGEFYDNVSADEYSAVMSGLMEEYKGDWNGYYILTVLAIVATFLSSWLLAKMTKKRTGTNDPAAASSKITTFILPVVMGVFTLTSSSTFALYLVVSQLLSIVSTLIFTPVVNKMMEKKRIKIEDKKPKIDYSR